MCFVELKTAKCAASERSTLQQPKEYFVEPSLFKKDFPNRAVKQKDIAWEQMQGKWVQGVSWTKHLTVQRLPLFHCAF